MVGKNGGAAFVVVYLLLIAIVGSTVMLAEFAVGRAARKTPVGAFWVLTGAHTWTLVGWVATLAGGFIILSYYNVIGGWTIKYIIGKRPKPSGRARPGRKSARIPPGFFQG